MVFQEHKTTYEHTRSKDLENFKTQQVFDQILAF